MDKIAYARRSAVLLALASVSMGAAADEADVFNFSFGRNALMDDNLFRLAPTADARAVLGAGKLSDTIDTTRLGMTMEKLLGRQRLKVVSSLTKSQYHYFSRFDNNGSSLAGSFNWILTDLVSGEISSSRNTSLSGFGNGQVQTPVRNINTAESSSANVNFRLHPDWHLVFGMQRSGSTNDSSQGQSANARISGSSSALRYSSGGGTELGVTASLSKGRYPNPQAVSSFFVDNSYDESSLVGDASLQPTGASRISGSLGKTHRAMRQLTERNFSGLTGSVGWDWQPTGKTSIVLQRRRDLGAAGDLNASYVVNDGLSLVANWSASAKSQISLSLDHRQSSYQGDPLAVASAIPKRKDIIDSIGLTANYQALRNLKLVASLHYEKRDSNYDGAVAGVADFRYQDRSASMNLEYSF